jgi:hypothetical protein
MPATPADDHVHVALVTDDGRLITVIQRTDLEDSLPDADPCSLGTLTGRVVAPDAFARRPGISNHRVSSA